MKFGKLGEKIGKLPIARVTRTSSGLFAGRHIPREKTTDPNWISVLELEKPPEDGWYMPRALARNPEGVEKNDRKKRKSLPIQVLYDMVRAAAEHDARKSKKNGKSVKTTKASKSTLNNSSSLRSESLQEKSSKTTITPRNWSELPPDSEAQILGIEQLGRGESVTVIGAGITGLCLAWILNRARPDVRINIVDANAHVGGWMNSNISTMLDGSTTLMESGPRTLVPSHPGTKVLLKILQELDKLGTLVGGVPRSASTNTKALIFDGKLTKLPRGFMETMSFIMTSPLLKGARWRMLRDFWIPARARTVDDESVHSFFSRRMGPLLADRMLSAVMRGIYGGDSRTLSARSVARLNKLFYLERTEQMSVLGAMLSGSLNFLDKYQSDALPLLLNALIDPREPQMALEGGPFSLLGFPNTGIQGMAQAIADDLRTRRNVKIQLETCVDEVLPYKNGTKVQTLLQGGGSIISDMVVATTATPSLYRTGSPQASETMANIPYANMAVVNVWTPEPVAKDWFGVLVPETENEWNKDGVLGVIFDSSVQNAMKPIQKNTSDFSTHPGSTMTVMIGGDLWPEKGLSEGEAINRAISGLQKIVGPLNESKITTKVTIQRQCIPQYTVGHSQRLHHIHEQLSKDYSGRVAVVGMALGRGVGVSDCVVDALTLATRFSEQRKLLHPEFFFGHWLMATRPEMFA